MNEPKNRLKTAQNKCIRFCLNLSSIARINNFEYRSVNWLPVDMRINQCIAAHAFRFCRNPAFNYMGNIVRLSNNPRIPLRNSHLKLYAPRRNKNVGFSCLSSKGPSISNILTNETKSLTNYNTFKHKIKETFLDSLDRVRAPNPYRL